MDMLVRLYDLPDDPYASRMAAEGVALRRPLATERGPLRAWVEAAFGAGWAGEADAAACRAPATCIIAVQERALLGFAAWDVAALGLFGPSGVAADRRGAGIGAALLFAALRAMRTQGYGYAVIGAVGPASFYRRIVGAVPIEGSSPGLFAGLLPRG
jgi:GNAT superfamily N-acetyltransferase